MLDGSLAFQVAQHDPAALQWLQELERQARAELGPPARVVVMYQATQSTLPETVPFETPDADIRRVVEKALRTGRMPGIPRDPHADLTHFSVARQRNAGQIELRPKTSLAAPEPPGSIRPAIPTSAGPVGAYPDTAQRLPIPRPPRVEPHEGEQLPVAKVAEPLPSPLPRLELMALRMAHRHQRAWQVHVALVVGVALVLLAVLVWSIVLATLNQTKAATFLGTGTLGGGVLYTWKWQPFDKMSEARRLADQADLLALAVNERMVTISTISDPAQREKAQWQAALDFLDASKPPLTEAPRKRRK
jgi:hypothetical protein